MRIASGVTDQVIYFVAVDSTDLKTRETGLSSFTVYRSRNGGAATAMTTPTVTEVSSSNMPGVYKLLLDEDMTIDAGDETQEMAFHITATGMAPVTRTIELYRPKITAGETLTSSSGKVTVGTNDDKTGYALSAAGVTAVQSGLATSANQTTIASYIDTEVAAIKAKTDNLPAAPAATGDIPSAATIATSVLTTQMTEAYAADGAAPTLTQALMLIQQMLTEKSVASTTLTVKKLDGTTPAATFTLDSDTAPTSIARAT